MLELFSLTQSFTIGCLAVLLWRANRDVRVAREREREFARELEVESAAPPCACNSSGTVVPLRPTRH